MSRTEDIPGVHEPDTEIVMSVDTAQMPGRERTPNWGSSRAVLLLVPGAIAEGALVG